MDCNFTLCKRYLNGNCIKQVGEKCQLEVAKEIIKSSVVLLTKPRTALDTKTYIMKAEQFLKENE